MKYEPAFPHHEVDMVTGSIYCTVPGMTLRDWFAGQAPYTFKDVLSVLQLVREKKNGVMTFEEISQEVAKANYIYADAMLKAREQV